MNKLEKSLSSQMLVGLKIYLVLKSDTFPESRRMGRYFCRAFMAWVRLFGIGCLQRKALVKVIKFK